MSDAPNGPDATDPPTVAPKRDGDPAWRRTRMSHDYTDNYFVLQSIQKLVACQPTSMRAMRLRQRVAKRQQRETTSVSRASTAARPRATSTSLRRSRRQVARQPREDRQAFHHNDLQFVALGVASYNRVAKRVASLGATSTIPSGLCHRNGPWRLRAGATCSGRRTSVVHGPGFEHPLSCDTSTVCRRAAATSNWRNHSSRSVASAGRRALIVRSLGRDGREDLLAFGFCRSLRSRQARERPDHPRGPRGQSKRQRPAGTQGATLWTRPL